MQGKCIPCLANNRAFRCEQVLNKTMFRTNQTNRIFQIYHNLNRKSKYVIFFLECTKCKVKYVGKTETEFDIRLNNHQKDVWKPVAIPARWYFSGKTFNSTHMQNSYWLNHIDTDKETNQERQKQRENYWILTPETLRPIGLNQELN